MSTREDQRSITTLVSDLTEQAATLVRTEFRLLRAEMSEKFDQVRNGGMEIVAGGICLLAALLVLLQALVLALAELGLGAGWASLIVGGVVAIVGLILVRMGTSNISARNLMPERTQEQLARDAHAIKEQTR